MFSAWSAYCGQPVDYFLQVNNKLNSKTESKLLETFIAIWQSTFRSVKSNNKKSGLAFFVFFHFPNKSLFLRFTKASLWDTLENKNKNCSFIIDSLQSLWLILGPYSNIPNCPKMSFVDFFLSPVSNSGSHAAFGFHRVCWPPLASIGPSSCLSLELVGGPILEPSNSSTRKLDQGQVCSSLGL